MSERCTCGSVSFDGEDTEKPYETPRAIHWFDKPCEAKPQPPSEVEALRAALSREKSRADRAEEALRPFAAFDPPRGCGTRDECVVYGSNVTGTMTEITVGDFRRARAALAVPRGTT